MIPYRDENETQRTAWVTLIIIGLCSFAWIFVQGGGSPILLAESVCDYGLIPGLLTGTVAASVRVPLGDGLVCLPEGASPMMDIFTSMFLHGSWMHLIGNMWFLWLFGNNVEDSMTRPRFAVFYLLCGVAAALLQVMFQPDSIVPMVGASGAISGVMGAYLVLYPRVRVFTLVPLGFFLTNVALPAWFMLIYWAFLQLAGGLTSIAAEQTGGVAFWAHLGGFLAGVVLIKFFVDPEHVREHQSHHWRPRRVSWY